MSINNKRVYLSASQGRATSHLSVVKLKSGLTEGFDPFFIIGHDSKVKRLDVCDNNLVRGPSSDSAEVLAAILGCLLLKSDSWFSMSPRDVIGYFRHSLPLQ